MPSLNSEKKLVDLLHIRKEVLFTEITNQTVKGPGIGIVQIFGLNFKL